MTKFTVNVFREMRVSYADIEADTPEQAANIAQGMPTDEADNVEECNGDDLSALVDVIGDESYSQSVMIDFEPERIRKAASALLAALQGIIDYAEGEAYSLEKLKDSPEAEAEAERAWKAVEAAQAAIAAAREADIPSSSPDIDIHALLARWHQIAIVWSIEDVQEIRPDLTVEQAWEVLQAVEKHHDCNYGITWDSLAFSADDLYPPPATDDAGEPVTSPLRKW